MASNDSGTNESTRRSRRDVLKTGAALVPVIMTLHAAPAWAATDYTMVAYTYGTNAGLCRNPNFDPNSGADWKSQEFMPCDQIRRFGGTTESESQTTSGTQDIVSF